VPDEVTPTASVPLLRVSGLCCAIGDDTLLDDLGFALEAAERVAIWGASGSGKSTLLRCLMGLSPPGSQSRGELRWQAQDARSFANPSSLASLRGHAIGHVSQSAAGSLDPVRTIARQLEEVLTLHRGAASPSELLARVHLDGAALELYPAQLSGGMAQRAALAIALAGSPKLLLADEPTAAMDNVLQRDVLDDLAAACDAQGTALLLVSHDLALVARYCERALVLVDGKLVADTAITKLVETTRDDLAPLVRANVGREDVSA
jgi:ABC-type glutathione transport system ATPase component